MADLVRVWSTGDPFEGEMLRGRLETEGIPVLVKGEGEGPYRVGPIHLFVSTEHETQARAVLDAVASGAFAGDLDEAFEEQGAGDEGA